MHVSVNNRVKTGIRLTYDDVRLPYDRIHLISDRVQLMYDRVQLTWDRVQLTYDWVQLTDDRVQLATETNLRTDSLHEIQLTTKFSLRSERLFRADSSSDHVHFLRSLSLSRCCQIWFTNKFASRTYLLYDRIRFTTIFVRRFRDRY